MVICNCLAVNDAAVRASILAGADTVEAVTAGCDAGGGCGRCVPVIEAMLVALGGDACAPEARRAA